MFQMVVFDLLLDIVHMLSAPPSKNAVSAFQISCKLLSFTLEDFSLKKLADDQCSSITKGSIYLYMNHMYIQPFTTKVDWPEIGCLMEVSVLYMQILRFYLGRQTFHNGTSWYYQFSAICFFVIMVLQK